MGATVLARLCDSLEATAKTGKLAAARGMLDGLVEEHSRVLLALNAQTAAA